jgi:hypothetical protein
VSIFVFLTTLCLGLAVFRVCYRKDRRASVEEHHAAKALNIYVPKGEVSVHGFSRFATSFDDLVIGSIKRLLSYPFLIFLE